MASNSHGLLREFYDRTAERFWDPAEGPIGRDLEVLPLLSDCHGTVMEYGFGSGSLLFTIAQKNWFSAVIGVDLSPVLVQRGREALAGIADPWARRVQLVQTEDDHVPSVATGSLDAIVSVATLEHTLDPYRVLDEFHRMSRPRGTLICSVPNYAYLKHRLTLLLGNLPRTGTDAPVERWRDCGWDGMHLHTFTQSSFETLLKSCGWTHVTWHGWGEKWPVLRPLRSRFPGILSGELIARCQRSDGVP